MEKPVDLGIISKRKAVTQTRQVNKFDLHKRVRPVEEIVRTLLFFCGLISILTTLGIIIILGKESLLFFNDHAWVVAKAPVAEATSAALLVDAIDADDTNFALTF